MLNRDYGKRFELDMWSFCFRTNQPLFMEVLVGTQFIARNNSFRPSQNVFTQDLLAYHAPYDVASGAALTFTWHEVLINVVVDNTGTLALDWYGDIQNASASGQLR